MLSDRRQKVLQALIEEYVANAMPVGSRTLTERYKLGASPATIRNELSRLESDGYVMQPHTSAGRIPTDSGYRAFVNTLLKNEYISNNSELREHVSLLKMQAAELDELLDQISISLARFTQCLSVVLEPSVKIFSFKQISLISISEYRFLLVVITEDGQVLNRQIESHIPVDAQELAGIQNHINTLIVGKSSQDIEQLFHQLSYDCMPDSLLMTVLKEILSCINDTANLRAHSLGMSSLLSKPEFAHSSSLIPVMRMVEDETALFEILNQTCIPTDSRDDVFVMIGEENSNKSLSGVSVVASSFGEGAAMGVVAVIGPTRMDYSKVISAVKTICNAVDEI